MTKNISATYITVWISVGKDAAPALSLHGRTKTTKPEITPAPGDYNPQKAEKIILDSSPKYSFGVKTQVEKISCTPGESLNNSSMYIFIFFQTIYTNFWTLV